MSTTEAIKSKLETAFSPLNLEIKDESHNHAGHQNFNGSAGTHLRIIMQSAQFTGKTRIDRHRAVHNLLQEELASHVHALALELTAPDEQPAR